MNEISAIESYHAHVYYDAGSKDKAAAVRAAIESRFDVTMGRWHDRPVGPHPMWSYQIAFAADELNKILAFLALNRDDLTVFVHPNTGDDVADHTRHAIWLGPQQELDISVLT